MRPFFCRLQQLLRTRMVALEMPREYISHPVMKQARKIYLLSMISALHL
jgi:hypothetical protein